MEMYCHQQARWVKAAILFLHCAHLLYASSMCLEVLISSECAENIVFSAFAGIPIEVGWEIRPLRGNPIIPCTGRAGRPLGIQLPYHVFYV